MSCTVQPYQPSLAAAWLFQRSMALKVGQLKARRVRRGGDVSGFLPASHINRLLRANFRVMQARLVVGCLNHAAQLCSTCQHIKDLFAPSLS